VFARGRPSGPSGQRDVWWRRRDSCSIPFGMGWTMPSSECPYSRAIGAGRVIRRLPPNPSAGSAACADQPAYESLQGEGSWPSRTPRRCQGIETVDATGFTE
jgi:hypothetical protein